MKKSYLFLIAAFLFSVIAQGQLSETPEETHLSAIIGTPEAAELKSHMSLTNTSSTAVEVKCKREIIYQVPGTLERFCWGGTCYGNGTEESLLTYTLAAGETYDWDELGTTGFTGYYNANDNAGTTQLKFTFYEVGNEDNSTAVTIHYCVDEPGVCEAFLSIENNDQAELKSASPNPANTYVNLGYSLNSSSGNNSIVIRNILGMMVDQIPVREVNGNLKLDVSSYEAGMYTYSIVSNDQMLSTKRFIVSH